MIIESVLIWSFISLFISLFLIYRLRLNIFKYVFHDFFTLKLFSFNVSFGIDSISVIFIILTLYIFPFVILALTSIEKNTNSFIFYLYLIEFLLILTFSTTNILSFYILFESILIPMFLLIGI